MLSSAALSSSAVAMSSAPRRASATPRAMSSRSASARVRPVRARASRSRSPSVSSERIPRCWRRSSTRSTAPVSSAVVGAGSAHARAMPSSSGGTVSCAPTSTTDWPGTARWAISFSRRTAVASARSGPGIAEHDGPGSGERGDVVEDLTGVGGAVHRSGPVTAQPARARPRPQRCRTARLAQDREQAGLLGGGDGEQRLAGGKQNAELGDGFHPRGCRPIGRPVWRLQNPVAPGRLTPR